MIYLIDKQDVILLLTQLREEGVDVTNHITATIKSGVSLETLKFINDHRQMDLSAFFEKIRHSYNSNKSKLYRQLMSDYTEEDTYEAICALNSLALQICVYAKHVKDKELFFKFCRLPEIYKCLYEYAHTYNIINSLKLLHLIKCDIKVLESCYRE